MTRMKIVADENIASLQETFALHGELITRPGRSLAAADLLAADALIVRSVTRVDEALLAGSKVGFVGSCTIGTDHIDLDYLARAGIRFVHAPGCNARAVAEYVVTALFKVLGDLSQWQSLRIGIVGYGNVGRRLAQLLDGLGVAWVAFDPVTTQDIPYQGSFDDILRCDIVSLHVPLTSQGAHATRHWFDAQVLQSLVPHALLINSARGAVINNTDLLSMLSADGARTGETSRRVVLDVFEAEPAINQALLTAVALATPHIAGYSVQGKQRGTWQVYRHFCAFLGIAAPEAAMGNLLDLDCESCSSVCDVILRAYDIGADDARLREGLGGDIATHFDAMRKNYPSRLEWNNRRLANIEHSTLQQTDVDKLRSLGFVC